MQLFTNASVRVYAWSRRSDAMRCDFARVSKKNRCDEGLAAHSIRSREPSCATRLQRQRSNTSLLFCPSVPQPHRISVRSVTHSRRTSRDAACTMLIGKEVIQGLGPTAVKASQVTATSAVISWLPSNSNHQHVVCVNNVEVRTVKPGVYRHTITGLAPSTIYRVTVKAKNLRATHFEDQSIQAACSQACHVHFKTLPKGLPDPPVDIQVCTYFPPLRCLLPREFTVFFSFFFVTARLPFGYPCSLYFLLLLLGPTARWMRCKLRIDLIRERSRDGPRK